MNIDQFQMGLVEDLKTKGMIRTKQVELAFRSIPRHLFLPGEPLDRVYSDQAIVVKHDAEGNWSSSSSQPSMMALMLEQLDLHKGQRVLEIGTGTGYNSALIASAVGPQGVVVTVDIQPDLVEEARKNLEGAGFGWVRAVACDGGSGYAPAAPYDRIILTAASSTVTPAWREQLVEDGRLVLPLEIGTGIQKSVAFQRQGESLVSVSTISASFMPLQGTYAAAQPEVIQLGSDPRLYLSGFHGFPANGAAIHSWFEQPQADRPIGRKASVKELLYSFVPWLIVHGITWAQLNAENELAQQDPFPAILSIGGEKPSKSTLALVSQNGMTVLRRPPGQDAPLENIESISEDFTTAFDLYVHPYGLDPEATNQLEDLLHRWDQDGRPPSDRLRFRVIPDDFPYELREGEYLLKRPWTNLITWYAENP